MAKHHLFCQMGHRKVDFGHPIPLFFLDEQLKPGRKLYKHALFLYLTRELNFGRKKITSFRSMVNIYISPPSPSCHLSSAARLYLYIGEGTR